MTKQKFSVAYEITCTSYYEETVEAETIEEAKRLVESQEVDLDMDESDHKCGKPVVTGVVKEGEF